MKNTAVLKADRYFIQSSARPSDGRQPFDPELTTRYYFDLDDYSFIDPNGWGIPPEFDLYESKLGEQPVKIYYLHHEDKRLNTAWWFKDKLTPNVFPGDVLVIKLENRDQWHPQCDPMMDVCREMKIFGIDEEADFGIHLDPTNIVGGTFYEIRGLLTGEDVAVIGYSIFKDRKISITETSGDILNLMKNDPAFVYTGSAYGKSHAVFTDALLPGNNYEIHVLLSDQSGRWQLYSESFTTKRREVYVSTESIYVNHNGDGDGSGETDARFQAHFSELQLDEQLNIVGNQHYERIVFGQFSGIKSNSYIPFGSFFASQFGPTKVTADHYVVIRSTAQYLDLPFGTDDADTAFMNRPLAPYLEGFALPFNKGRNEEMLNAKFSVAAITDNEGPFEVTMTVSYNVIYQ